MCKFFGKESKKSAIAEFVASAVAVREDLAGIELMHSALLDDFQPYYYTDGEGWAKVFDYIYFKFPMPHKKKKGKKC